MIADDIRQKFLDFFKAHGHTIVKSDSLVPKADPTLLFTSAGMVQFKDYFLGKIKKEFTRAASCQKCLRTSDIEKVGRTGRHHTFFEMLGNFSFGDYFKEEAISWAWEFVTEHLKINTERLWITVYTEDDEAYLIWREKIGLPHERIVRLGDETNFWKMGDVGPCGPCSEIIYDQGDKAGCGKAECNILCDCDRYIELWNLVFTQFDRQPDGSLKPLPSKNIDTGMGLERAVAIVQGKLSDFETELFSPIIDYICEFTALKYGNDTQKDVYFRIIADHIRAITFLISEGILPTNEGRGYILRRLIRRAYRHGRLLNINNPFLYRLAGVVVDLMHSTYPELKPQIQYISSVILSEERRFESTLDTGLFLLSEWIEKLKNQERKEIPGDIVFKLYDTYGFPLELTAEIAAENGLTIDQEGYTRLLETQQAKARAAWQSMAVEIPLVFKEIEAEFGDTEFLGYKKSKVNAKVLALVKDEKRVEKSFANEEIIIVTDRTVFYAEAGGQVGDTGWIINSKGFKAEVVSTKKYAGNSILHYCKIKEGTIKVGDRVTLSIDIEKRLATARNHTATHLLQASLRQVLGMHVRQAGSLVEPARLRFDFTHFQPLSQQELDKVEELVNEKILLNLPVKTYYTSLEEAQAKGAIALFDEKYGDKVRVVQIDDFSMELCGGTHLSNTGEIGLFIITSSTAVGAGVRRIEAVTGKYAYKYIKEWKNLLERSAEDLKCDFSQIPARIQRLIQDNRRLEKEIERVKIEGAFFSLDDLISKAIKKDDVNLIVQKIPNSTRSTLLSIADRLRIQLKKSVVVLSSVTEGKVNIVVLVTEDLTDRIHAGNLAQKIASLVNGSGGGRADLGQGGGRDVARLDEALAAVSNLVP